jgi:hypothetical protein
MDNSMIKQMMQMQGMQMSDEQINMMKTNINPDMFKMMANNPEMMENAAKFKMNNQSNTTSTNNSSQSYQSTQSNSNIKRDSSIDREESFGGIEQSQNMTRTQQPQQNMQFPTGLPGNMDMSSMFKFVQNNPDIMKMMGPQMANMMGGQGQNPEVMMKAMENIMWLISIPQRTKAFFTSTRGIIFLVCMMILILAYFYR